MMNYQMVFAMLVGALLGYGLYYAVPAPIKLVIIAAYIVHVAWKRSRAR